MATEKQNEREKNKMEKEKIRGDEWCKLFIQQTFISTVYIDLFGIQK